MTAMPKFGEVVNGAVSAIGLSSTRTSFRSPWQNGVAERWVGSCRQDLLDHVIPLSERHLKRVLSEYIRYLPCRPNSSGIGERYTASKTSCKISSALPGCLIPQTRWSASSLRPGCLASVDFRVCVLESSGKGLSENRLNTLDSLFAGSPKAVSVLR
jgi:hypothetical protein